LEGQSWKKKERKRNAGKKKKKKETKEEEGAPQQRIPLCEIRLCIVYETSRLQAAHEIDIQHELL